MNELLQAPLAALVLVSLLLVQTNAAENATGGAGSGAAAGIGQSADLQKALDRAVQMALQKFADKKLGTNQIALTLVDLRDPQHPAQASYRGGEQIYPASVIKLFYLVAVHRWLEDGKLRDSEELRRAMRT